MALSFNRRRRIRFPITLSVALIVLNVTLMVCWIVLLAMESYWSALTIGTVVFALILVGLVVYTVLTLKEIQLNLRQANFVDSVTHELKSPIASLRLYLETLQLRKVGEEQRTQFYNVMMEDLQRLDRLINQLLQVGRLDAIVTENEAEDIELKPLLERCAVAACNAHSKPAQIVSMNVEPVMVRGARMALEMIFGNLIDNAVKYGGAQPEVVIETKVVGDNKVVTRIIDNGAGVPLDHRKKVFALFFRGGSELERRQKGTGLGLYIVHTLVRKMKGRVSIHGRGRENGSIFEVELPGRGISCDAS
jgi:signal transduction histidine kinase